MKSILLLLHLVFAGLWLGCVLTEVLFERALHGSGPFHELALARLHLRVDVVVEIPAFFLVLATGALMLASTDSSPLLQTKIGFGLIAIAANIYCVWLVFCRAKAAIAGQWAEFSNLDRLQHRVGAIVLLGILMALVIGGYLFVLA